VNTLTCRDAALAAIAALAINGHAAYAKDPALLSLSMEHFRDTAAVSDGLTDDTATISTENGFAEHTGVMRMVWHDEFLRADIDKKSGRKSFQVYAWIIYGGGFRSYETVSFQTGGGTHSMPVTRLGKSVDSCAVGECTYTERMAFPVDEETLRHLAVGNGSGGPAMWPIRFTAHSGPAYADGLSSAEIAGFLAKVDEYTGALPLLHATAASASLQLDLGVGGIPVAATEEWPKRAGILLIGVSRGSVAHESGLIVGDILYELDGHPLKTLADLQAAVAGCAKGSIVAVKLFRGTVETAVTAKF